MSAGAFVFFLLLNIGLIVLTIILIYRMVQEHKKDDDESEE